MSLSRINWWNQVCDAIEEGEEAVLRKLFEHDHFQNDSNMGLLLYAAQSNPNMIEVLVACGVDLNESDSSQQTALHNLAGGGEFEWLKFLLDRGANPNVPNDSGETPLSYAAVWEHPTCVALLLKYGANPNPKFASGDLLLDDPKLPLEIRRLLEESDAQA